MTGNWTDLTIEAGKAERPMRVLGQKPKPLGGGVGA